MLTRVITIGSPARRGRCESRRNILRSVLLHDFRIEQSRRCSKTSARSLVAPSARAGFGGLIRLVCTLSTRCVLRFDGGKGMSCGPTPFLGPATFAGYQTCDLAVRERYGSGNRAHGSRSGQGGALLRASGGRSISARGQACHPRFRAFACARRSI